MANELFNRVATLRVGPKGGPTKAYGGLRISFEVDKTSDPTPNPAKISIYNLNPKSRADLESTGLVMALDVGYLGLGTSPIFSQIFTGDVKRVRTERQGADLVTTLEAGDSEVAIRETHIEQSFAENASAQDVMAVLAKKLGVAMGTIMPGIASLFESGISLSGLVSDHLDVLTKNAGLEWFVTDGELNILDPKLPTSEEPVLVSPASGLIGIPSKREDGYEFTSLLNPLIKPGRSISLVSQTISGLIKARNCRYAGDTHGAEWTVTVEAG